LATHSGADEFKKLPAFAGCVAVVNYPMILGQANFEEAAKEEEQHFKRVVFDHLPPAYHNRAEEISKNMSIPTLIRRMDAHFHSFIVGQWKPAALSDLQPDLDKVEQQLKELGAPIEELTYEDVVKQVMSRVSSTNPCVNNTRWPSCVRPTFFFPFLPVGRRFVSRKEPSSFTLKL
jgi:hypothetical protein